MASDIFIQFDGIKGESHDAAFPDAIDVMHWQFLVEQDARMLSGSGGGASKASVSDLVFQHELDCASPTLAAFCFQGKHISEVKLSMRKAGGMPFTFYRITLSDVVITKVLPSADGSYAIETVGLSFSRMKQEYLLQSRQGGNMGAVTGLIDVRQSRTA
ncbi:putative cytoplasmic protein USSDB7A [Burkholderia sp. 8Y]|uniref:Hcp family type VI secretion system effector n=1 Tax=Burkholderia sp. 8Y TaxID=2653133 RepID=UPI0012F1BA49|nr:type VI secretion system tube protein Hcp [Burkholderia sp. 8Y]VXC89129.1 putative cytoplasmic protein USSDB7A [Burkholderia sp. 8Y]